jgi:hypothetical protein
MSKDEDDGVPEHVSDHLDRLAREYGYGGLIDHIRALWVKVTMEDCGYNKRQAKAHVASASAAPETMKELISLRARVAKPVN